MRDRNEDGEVESLLNSPTSRTSIHVSSGHTNQAISPRSHRTRGQESAIPPPPLATASTTSRLSLSRRLAFPSILLNILLIVALWLSVNWTTSVRYDATSAASFQDKEQLAPTTDKTPKVFVATASLQKDLINATTTITTYGHVHMAKTAGTEINGYLAARYERICGHKGYSYDAYQFNLRVKEAQQNTGKKGLSVIGEDDIISKQKKDWNRGRVPNTVMQEIGFEDCDWISVETPAKFWYNDTNWPIPKPLELHVPCRDPVNHLMSQCNHKGKRLDCSNPNIGDQIRQCFLGLDRFDFQLTRARNVTLKCFNPIPIEPYMQYMGSVLQEKRIPAKFIHRESNKPRDKSKECIWKNDKVREKVLDMLLQMDYYKFCQQCMGGSDDLLVASGEVNRKL